MKIITEKRGEMIRELIAINPTKIVSFSQIDIDALDGRALNVVINTNFASKQKRYKNWEIKTNNKVHAKVAIGADGLIIGSWNFSKNSTGEMHEAIIVLRREEISDELWVQVNRWFDSLSERSNHIG